MLSIDDSDVFHCYQDLWKTAQERSNSQYQGIDLSDDRNMDRICVGAGNKDETETEDAAIALAFGNRFHIPLDFELLETHVPFYQSALGDRLEYELTFKDYSGVVVATGDSAASYKVESICLEFDIVSQPDLAWQIRNQYAGHLAILYDRVLRHRKTTANKNDTLWNINLNVPARSMKGILLLFEDPAAAFQWDTEAFSITPRSRKSRWPLRESQTSCTARAWGLISFGKRPGSTSLAGQSDIPRWPWSRRFSRWPTYPWGSFSPQSIASGWSCAPLTMTSSMVAVAGLRMPQRVSRSRSRKKAETAGALNIYLYVLMDAQLNIEDGRFVSALYWAMLAADQPPFGNHLWANGLREDSLCPEPSRGPLPWGLPPRRDPMPHHQAQQDLPESPADLGGPRVLCHRPWWKVEWLPPCYVSGRLQCKPGSDQKEGHAVRAGF